ncbi:outer spore coat protein CotE [Salipaludibacillus aurantiacus]|uniref:Spore coat protein E n=1 Tax=Salipaludibacillus aurantiacus TaxID=1601833 RepID=A0A1H9QF75_9BACI|nr:outer spore coat protein CotE [Salipaludibacillus aurantiacus]SER59050.1 spore coat protein E [Salipaludibacillus aurantiacus]
MSSEKDVHYRQIITKAVCGKGRKFSETKHKITPAEKPTSILGCWLINHKYTSAKKGDAVEINGTYDCNIWYSYSGNTKTNVATETVSYTEVVPLVMQDSDILSEDLEVISRATQQPNTLEALIASNDRDVEVQVEKEFAVEVIGETKMTVQVNPNASVEEWDEEAWDDTIDDEEFEDLDTNFLAGELEE